MKQVLFILFCAISLLFIQPVFAYKTIDASGKALNSTVEPTGLSTDDLQTTTGNLIKGALTAVGTVFFGLMVYGGYLWMTARGEEDQITRSKETIIAAIIGLAVILAAYAATNFVTTNLIK